MDVYKVLNRYLNPNIRQALNNRELLDTAEEIRIRQNKPLVIKKGNENFFMKNGNACSINEALDHKKMKYRILYPVCVNIRHMLIMMK